MIIGGDANRSIGALDKERGYRRELVIFFTKTCENMRYRERLRRRRGPPRNTEDGA